jgi:hypothetical protein
MILPLYGEGSPLCCPQDDLSPARRAKSRDAIAVYYRHRLASNNVSGKMWIQSTCIIAQINNSTSSFKHYLLDERSHINNSQFGAEEAIVLGRIPVSHPAFSFRESMRESITELLKIEYSNFDWALSPKTILYTISSNGAKLSTSGVLLKVTKQEAGQVETMREDIAMMWQVALDHRGGHLVGKNFLPFGKQETWEMRSRLELSIFIIQL